MGNFNLLQAGLILILLSSCGQGTCSPGMLKDSADLNPPDRYSTCTPGT